MVASLSVLSVGRSRLAQQRQVAAGAHGQDAEEAGRAVAGDLRAVAGDSDVAVDERQTVVAIIRIGVGGGQGERAVGGQVDRVGPGAGPAFAGAGEERAVVVGVDDGLDERALTVVGDDHHAVVDGDGRGVDGHRPQRAGPQRQQQRGRPQRDGRLTRQPAPAAAPQGRQMHQTSAEAAEPGLVRPHENTCQPRARLVWAMIRDALFFSHSILQWD